MKAILRGALAAMLVLWTASLAVAADRAIIVLDASGSMWGQIDGKPKVEIARETLRTVLQSVPADLELGLMAYGHREKGSCEDIELIVPPQPGTAGAITAAADAMKFLGKTPLSAAVKQAAEALKYTEDKATVILITDGIETCNGDPCALGKELESAGIDFTAQVVGFGLTAEEGRQVACLAENTGGKYFQASDAAGLTEALAAVVTPKPAPEPVLPAPPAASDEIANTPPVVTPPAPAFNFIPRVALASGAEPLKDAGNAWEIYRADATGAKGPYVTTQYNQYKGNLEPGGYVIRAALGQASVEQTLTVEAGKVYEPLFVLNAGTLVVRPRPSEGAAVDSKATVSIAYPGGSAAAITYGETRAVLPAGEQKLTVKLGEGEATETIQLAAGQTVEKDVVIGVGRIVANAIYTAGGEKVTAGGLFVEIAKAAKKLDGSREVVASNYGPDTRFSLPTGDYVALARLDKAQAEQPFNIRAGEAKDVTVTLEAGVLAIEAPGAYSIEIVAAKKDIQGNRQSFGLSYGGSWQPTMPAGDYAVIRALPNNGGTKEAPATVHAGERTEVKVE